MGMETAATLKRPTPSGTWATFHRLQKNSTTEPQETSGFTAKTTRTLPHTLIQAVSTTSRPAMQTTENSSITILKIPKISMRRLPNQILHLQTVMIRSQSLRTTCDFTRYLFFYNIIFKA